MPSNGLLNPEDLAEGHIKRAVVTLPEGVTLNPSAGEGLQGCSRAQLDEETVESTTRFRLPQPVEDRHGRGHRRCSTKPRRLALHGPARRPPATTPKGRRTASTPCSPSTSSPATSSAGSFKLAGKVEPDPRTGQITTTFTDLPQLPFSDFHLHFREGGRAPLVSPLACGTYTTTAELTPWARPDQTVVETTSEFQITRGVGGGPCPSGGLPPFAPGLIAGTRNNNAGSYSPFDLRLFSNDGEQEFTHFSIKLPPGVTGKLAGIPVCPDAALAFAKTRSGAAELASPSCPEASYLGRTLVGAGVGSVLTYAPGRIYLAGPYNGSRSRSRRSPPPRSAPSTSGLVVVRQALRINRETAEVFIDATGSDPIPHIIDGITTHLRDIRAYVDRP